MVGKEAEAGGIAKNGANVADATDNTVTNAAALGISVLNDATANDSAVATNHVACSADVLNADASGDNSYDGEKLKLLVHDESGKWERPTNILNNWRVTKTCLRLGSRIIGKCMMGSTSNSLDKGGDNFKKLYNDSDVTQRNANGQTRSGLYSLFIPMEWNYE